MYSISIPRKADKRVYPNISDDYSNKRYVYFKNHFNYSDLEITNIILIFVLEILKQISVEMYLKDQEFHSSHNQNHKYRFVI